MGIPHLTVLLQPYAPLVVLSGQDFVIDGPGFAYNTYYVCLSRSSGERSSFDAVPSYQELGSAAVAWLDEVERGGNRITKILFDGFLPLTKLDTRFERLSAQTKHLTTYYQSHLSVPRGQSKRNLGQLPPLFPTTPFYGGRTALPPPPFLVPAVIEILGSSNHYKTITQVVPGEADIYCAEYVKQHGGIVMTGDSDLLLHDLDPESSVCFFKDLELSSDDTLSTLRGRQYHPTQICKQLSLPLSDGLRPLGFELFVDNHCSLPKAVLQAISLKAATRLEGQYADFRKGYLSSSIGSAYYDIPVSHMQAIQEALLNIQCLDPRVSEYVLQFPRLLSIAKNSSVLEPSNSDTTYIFLPFLLGCPNRASAWEISTSIRELAYSLMNLSVPKDQQRLSVLEHRTRQGNASGKLLQLPPVSGIFEACTNMMDLLSRVRSEHSKACSESLWVAVACHLDVEISLSQGKTSLTQTVREQIAKTSKNSETFKNYSWEVVHLQAQVEGLMYSFRVLKQISSLIVSCSAESSVPDVVLSLSRELDCLPKLVDFPNTQDTIRLVQICDFGDFGKADSHATATKLSKKTSKVQGPSVAAKMKRKTNTANPFHTLATG